MKTSVIAPLLAVALLMTAATASSAQNAAGDQEKGSTGWSGGAKDQVGQSATGSQNNPAKETTGQKVQNYDEASAKTQPWLATGEGLNGPPVQLAPSQTPE
jgi:hypothetical protein